MEAFHATDLGDEMVLRRILDGNYAGHILRYEVSRKEQGDRHGAPISDSFAFPCPDVKMIEMGDCSNVV